jgi:hypothetical protein
MGVPPFGILVRLILMVVIVGAFIVRWFRASVSARLLTRTSLREPHEGAAFVQLEPALGNRAIECRAVRQYKSL